MKEETTEGSNKHRFMADTERYFKQTGRQNVDRRDLAEGKLQ
jgi:hypothetical protein